MVLKTAGTEVLFKSKVDTGSFEIIKNLSLVYIGDPDPRL
jgi:hypothetical protein